MDDQRAETKRSLNGPLGYIGVLDAAERNCNLVLPENTLMNFKSLVVEFPRCVTVADRWPSPSHAKKKGDNQTNCKED
jgi:hypothetical protein